MGPAASSPPPTAEFLSSLVALPTPSPRFVATVHDPVTALHLSLGLIVTLVLLFFPVLLPSFALILATAAGYSYMVGYVGWWEGLVGVALAVDLAFVPGMVALFALLFAFILGDELGVGFPAEWPQEADSWDVPRTVVKDRLAKARLAKERLANIEEGDEGKSEEWWDAQGMVPAEEVYPSTGDIGKLSTTGGDSHEEELEGWWYEW